MAEPCPPAFGSRLSRQNVGGAAVMSFPGNIIPPGEFFSKIVKKCEQKDVLTLSIRLSEKYYNYVNECKVSGAGYDRPPRRTWGWLQRYGKD